MAALSAVLALGLMAYVPGRLLLRFFLPRDAPLGSGGLLLEFLVGNAAVGLVGFVLAEIGWFSLPAVLAGLALLSLAGAVWGSAPGPRLSRQDTAGALVAGVMLAWVLPPFDTTLWGNDSSVYVGGGLSLARNGGLAFPDSTITAMSPAQRQSFFPSYGRTGRPPYIRVGGGLLLTDLDEPSVVPAFHHLLSVWVALSWSIAGDAALAAPASYFAALAAWALAAFAARLGGRAVAMATVLLLAASAPQYWYSRFLMPEVPSQYFLWAGLVAAATSLEVGRSRLGAVAGLGLGVAGMLRIDGLAHLVAALAVWRGIGPGTWPAGPGFVPAFAALGAWSFGHQIAFPTHYLAEAAQSLQEGWGRVRGRFAGIAGVAGGVAGGAVRLVALLVFAAYVVGTVVSTRPDYGTSLGWMTTYVGWPSLLGGAIGAVLWWRRGRNPAERFALLLALLVLAQLFYDPRVTPAALWAVRRFVALAIPLLLIGTALVVGALWRWHRFAGVAALVVALAGSGSHGALAYRGGAFENSIEHVRALGSYLPADAVLAVDPSLGVVTQVQIAVWSALGVPTYMLGAGMSEPLAALGRVIGDRPLYWLGGGDPSALAQIGGLGEPVVTYRFAVGVRHMDWYDARDDLEVREQTFYLYRLHPSGGERRPSGALH